MKVKETSSDRQKPALEELSKQVLTMYNSVPINLKRQSADF